MPGTPVSRPAHFTSSNRNRSKSGEIKVNQTRHLHSSKDGGWSCARFHLPAQQAPRGMATSWVPEQPPHRIKPDTSQACPQPRKSIAHPILYSAFYVLHLKSPLKTQKSNQIKSSRQGIRALIETMQNAFICPKIKIVTWVISDILTLPVLA
jgi:hypothetical protein